MAFLASWRLKISLRSLRLCVFVVQFSEETGPLILFSVRRPGTSAGSPTRAPLRSARARPEPWPTPRSGGGVRVELCSSGPPSGPQLLVERRARHDAPGRSASRPTGRTERARRISCPPPSRRPAIAIDKNGGPPCGPRRFRHRSPGSLGTLGKRGMHRPCKHDSLRRDGRPRARPAGGGAPKPHRPAAAPGF